ncbi:hypothetical protein MAR_007950 [Mya arenaria]|uniref:HTH psq-type domain-containing protein n=1 Tax=Mya arenaria TaxID=6604 RepID=A0ABY7DXP5_MYAAR|nr:hypothetical protein MAR_007950 [Mya arenaria]
MDKMQTCSCDNLDQIGMSQIEICPNAKVEKKRLRNSCKLQYLHFETVPVIARGRVVKEEMKEFNQYYYKVGSLPPMDDSYEQKAGSFTGMTQQILMPILEIMPNLGVEIPGSIQDLSVIKTNQVITFTLLNKEKYDAIKEDEGGMKSQSKIAEAFGIPLNTLSTWLKQKEYIKSLYLSRGIEPARKKSLAVPSFWK